MLYFQYLFTVYSLFFVKLEWRFYRVLYNEKWRIIVTNCHSVTDTDRRTDLRYAEGSTEDPGE